MDTHDVVSIDVINNLVAEDHGLLDLARDLSAIRLGDRNRFQVLFFALDLH